MNTERVKLNAREKAKAVEQYNSVVESAELRDVRVMDASFSVQPAYFSAKRTVEGRKRLRRALDCKVSQLAYKKDSGTLAAQFNWTVEVTTGRKKVLKATVTYFVAYDEVPIVEEEHAEAFVQKVGRFTTYPYFRSLIAQLSWESKANLPIMPVLK